MKFNGGLKRCFESRLLCWSACACVAALLLAMPANAEINVPETCKSHQPIVITVKPSNVPEGAKVRGSVVVSDAALLPGSQEGQWHVWAGPGRHSVTASGVWVLTRDVAIEGQSVPLLVDFGQYSETASFVVEGDEEPSPDPPEPVPPGPVPQTKWLVIVEESSKRTPKQANLYQQLRTEKLGKVVVADRDSTASTIRQYVDLIEDDSDLPVVFVVDSSGKVYRQIELPDSVEAIKELLQ